MLSTWSVFNSGFASCLLLKLPPDLSLSLPLSLAGSLGASEMTQWVKALAADLDNLSIFQDPHGGRREPTLRSDHLTPLMGSGMDYAHTNKYTK